MWSAFFVLSILRISFRFQFLLDKNINCRSNLNEILHISGTMKVQNLKLTLRITLKTLLNKYHIFISRSHLNHNSNLFFQVPNNFGMLARWWRELNHNELMQQFVDYLLDMDTSNVIIHDLLYIVCLLE